MKTKFFKRIRIALIMFSVCLTAVSQGRLVTLQAPEEADLNDDFTVRVRQSENNWITIPSYLVNVTESRETRKIVRDASMAYFDFSGEVEVSVTYNRGTIETARIRPLSYQIEHQLNGNTITFKLNQPRNLSIEVNGDIFQNLHLFVNPIEDFKPDPKDKNVMYFGPGIHRPEGRTFRVPSGTTVYVSGGAILMGQILVSNARDVKILGRGMVDRSIREGIRIQNSKNVYVEGLLCTQLPTGNSDSVTIRNVKTISYYQWGDGMNVFASNNVLFDGVFNRNSDDCTTVYATRGNFAGSCKNIRMQNSTLWADVAHPIFIGIHGNADNPDIIEDVSYYNIDILDHNEMQVDYQGCLAINAGDNNLIRNIRFENIRIENFRRGQLVNLRIFFNEKYCKAPGRGIENVLFKDITYNGDNSELSMIIGYSEERKVKNIRFENLKINGQVISDDMPGKPGYFKTTDMARFFVGEFVEGIEFVKSSEQATIRPAQILPDINGSHINAHCGHIIKHGDIYYWYGENRLGARSQVTCYSSSDLSNWTFRNTVLKDLGDEEGFVERPKVVFNDKTGKFVMWMHKEGRGGYSEARAAVAIADTPDGNFKYLGSFRPNGNMSRDCYLFKDDDGTAYFISAAKDNADLNLYRLSDDYLTIDKELATLFAGQYREAPVIFKRNGFYYLLSSFCTGTKPNQQYYSMASSIIGPWTDNKLLTANRTWNTYYSQGAYAFEVQGSKATTYVFGSDRWVRPMRHVWLPLSFADDGLILPLEWADEWHLNAYTGEFLAPEHPTPLADNIAKGKPVVATYDKPGAMFDYGHFANHLPEYAVDGDPTTAWAANDNLAHWLMVDLGKVYELEKLVVRFWKSGEHRFRVEISNDNATWRTLLEKSLKPKTIETTELTTDASARFLRLWYLGSESGYNWTAISELSVYSEGKNVALNKPATASDYQHPTVAANVVDGNFATAWVMEQDSLPQSVTIDLLKLVETASVRILWEAAGVAHQYTVEGSANGQTWNMLTDQSTNDKAISQAEHHFTDCAIRYLRVGLISVDNLGIRQPKTSMRPWPGIREIEVIPVKVN